MNVSVHILLAAVCAVSLSSPQKGFNPFLDEDAAGSGAGSDRPIQGVVKVVHLNPRFLGQSPFFSRRPPSSLFGLGAPATGGIPTPFLGLGRRAVPARSGPGSLLKPQPHLESGVGVVMHRKQGMDMWKKAIQRDSVAKEGLPVTLKEASQTACRAVSFRQRVSAPGCLTVTLQNKLCLGLCNSLFVPAVGDAGSAEARPEQRALSASCSLCAPVKTRTALVPMLCEGVERVRERRVTVIEECQCESRNRGAEETLLRSLLLKR